MYESVSDFVLFYFMQANGRYVIFSQDPVYGKGKLGEIQGLVLGMLDSFNYEQVSRMDFFILFR